MPVQWAHLGADEILVASSRGAWIQARRLGALGFFGPMPDSLPGTLPSTAHLLDGAIAAAERAVSDRPPTPMSALRWAWQLVSQWYLSRHTVALHAEVAERYLQSGREDLARFAARKFEQESGHEQFPLADLWALGYDAEAVVRAVSPDPAAVRLIDYARECVRGAHPVEFLGYGHGIERHVIRITPAWWAALEAALPPGLEAASGLRAHASELDIAHVEEAVSFFAGLPAADRTNIALACYRTSQIRVAPTAGTGPTELELEAWLSPFRAFRVPPGGRSDRQRQGALR